MHDWVRLQYDRDPGLQLDNLIFTPGNTINESQLDSADNATTFAPTSPFRSPTKRQRSSAPERRQLPQSIDDSFDYSFAEDDEKDLVQPPPAVPAMMRSHRYVYDHTETRVTLLLISSTPPSGHDDWPNWAQELADVLSQIPDLGVPDNMSQIATVRPPFSAGLNRFLPTFRELRPDPTV